MTDSQTATPISGRRWRADAPAEAVERLAPEETAVGLSFDGRPHAVLMATPADLQDLAVGFTVSEGIAGVGDIASVTVEAHDQGVLVDVRFAVRPQRVMRRRTLEGRSSCGLCGIQRLEDAVRPLEAVESGVRVSPEAIQAALAELEGLQALGAATRATHAAAWADAAGRVVLVREDVGRHNALDKLIGAALRAGLDPATAVLVVTSRCSYEMVEKAASAGVGVLVAISAPTALAIRKAEEAGVTLVALARADGHTVFTRGDRIVEEVPA